MLSARPKIIVTKNAVKINSSMVLLNRFVISAQVIPLIMLKTKKGNRKKVLLKTEGFRNSSSFIPIILSRSSRACSTSSSIAIVSAIKSLTRVTPISFPCSSTTGKARNLYIKKYSSAVSKELCRNSLMGLRTIISEIFAFLGEVISLLKGIMPVNFPSLSVA